MTVKNAVHDEPSAAEKWQTECAFRERELVLAEVESKRKADELDLHRDEQKRSRWRSPLVVAIGAAAVAGFGNAIVAFNNNSSQMALEDRRSEQARILEMIKTGDVRAASENLRFLLDAGLITDPGRADQLRAYLNRPGRSPDAGPVLPSAGAPVAQRAVNSLRVDLFYCESAGREAERLAREAARVQTGQGGSWTPRPLPPSLNSQPQFRVAHNEIRYNADELAAATAVQQALQQELGLSFALNFGLQYTSGYMSVFFCEGATDIPEGASAPDAANMSY